MVHLMKGLQLKLKERSKEYGGAKDDIPSADRGKLKKDSAEAEDKADYEQKRRISS